MEYVEYRYKYSRALRAYDVQFFDHVSIPRERKANAKRILFVLDYMPSEALHTKRLFQGSTGDLFSNLVWVAENVHEVPHTLSEYDWLAISFNSFKTVGGNKEFLALAQEEFAARLREVITTYKPDAVVTFGREPADSLNKQFISKYRGKKGVQYQHFYGVPIPTTVGEHSFLHVSTLSLRSLQRDDTSMSLCGYVAHNLTSALNMGAMYKIPELDFQIEVIDTVAKFDVFYKKLCAAKYVAIDTEGRNLNKIKNYTVTWQFALDTDVAYILPFLHKDSPFLPEELDYIRQKLRLFFECRSKAHYHIYANAAFDLSMARRDLGVRFFKNDVWDIFAGDYVHDENMERLQKVTGYYYYSLLNLSMQYGCTAYYDSDFGKEQRAFIADLPLTPEVLHYMALDVILPMYIMRLQRKRGKHTGYKYYTTMVRKQVSDQIHNLANIEFNGSRMDIDWLFYLKSPDSPILKEREKALTTLLSTEGAVKTNNLLLQEAGAPPVGLYGRVKKQVFRLSKTAHKEKLFFDVLKLKPLSLGETGKGQIDKDFQNKYADVPEVAAYTAIQKINKLFDAYVKSFIKKWGADDDFRNDRRMRARYGYLKIVSGRCNASDPNLQTIPSRGAMGKYIKRLFVPDDGCFTVKVDFCVFEVKCWALMSDDKEVAKTFQVGMDLRNAFKHKPTMELAQEVEYKGDVHKINASYFFRIPIEKIDKAKRNSVKTVIFGLIYQQGEKGTAKSINATVEVVKDLTAKFFKRFPVGSAWFQEAKNQAKKFLYFESPLGRRRHLYGMICPKSHPDYSSIYSRNERQAVNNPVQGMGSDFMMIGARCIEKQRYKLYRTVKKYFKFIQTNTVHDSLEFSVEFSAFWPAVRTIENGLTSDVKEEVKRRYGFEFIVDLEIDFEIGASLDTCEAWNFALSGDYKTKEKESLADSLKNTLDNLNKMGRRIDPLHFYTEVDKNFSFAPDWAKSQRMYLTDTLGYDPLDPKLLAKRHENVEK